MSTSKVLIPVVVLPGPASPQRETRLWEVLCRPASLPEQARALALEDKRLHPTVHLLGSFKRYDSGMKGLWAVKRLLGAGTPAGDPESALRHLRLDSGDGAAWVGRIEEHSSDLGLGLALLMETMHTRERLLAATGELGDAQDCGVEGDAVVKAVRDMPEKLRAVLEKKRSGGRFDALRLMFTPCHYLTPEGELELVQLLDVVRELRNAGIEVCPVRTFGEAARRLGVNAQALETANRRARMRAEWRRRLGCGARIVSGVVLAIGLAVAACVGYSLTRPVALAWVLPTHGAETQPFVVCSDAGDKAGAFVAIRRRDFIPVVPTSSLLAWQARIGDPAETGQWGYRLARLLGYEGYHLAVAMLGKTTGIGEESVIVPKLSEQSGAVQRIRPGQVWSYGWKLDPVPEPTLLLVLVNRRHAFNVAALQADLRQRFGKEPGRLDFSAVIEYLREQTDGFIPFVFETRPKVPYCHDELR
jgi:hypothetical protein